MRNAFEIHLVNKRNKRSRFELRADSDPRLRYTIGMPEVTLSSLADQRVPVFIDFSRGAVRNSEHTQLELWQDDVKVATIDVPLLAPQSP